MADSETITLTSRCLCGASKVSRDVPRSRLPLEAGFCHCDSCRHNLGTLAFDCGRWPKDFPPDLSKLKEYAWSARTSVWFCETCGTTMFWTGGTSGTFIGATVGSMENAKDLYEYRFHVCIGDTKDGGMSDWVAEIRGQTPRRWKDLSGSEELPLGWKEEGKQSAGEKSDHLNAWCLCKGVEFKISKPTEESANPALNTSEEFPKHIWWLDSNRTRYRSSSCVCDSCRLASGSNLMTWAFIPETNLHHPDGSPLNPATALFGTLKSYRSSDYATRYFCGQCGATAFWVADDQKRILDVAVGLLDAESGARAEEWLWIVPERIANIEDGLKRGVLTEDVKKGLAAWAKRREE